MSVRHDDHQDDENEYPYDEPEDDDAGPPPQLTVIGPAGTGPDPLFSLLLTGAVSIGLTPLISNAASDMRYTIVWAMLSFFAVFGWLLTDGPRIGKERIENLAWGISLGLILGLPLLAFGSTTLRSITDLLFEGINAGAVLAYLLFVLPLAETLFFRGLLQANRSFWSTALIATLWGLVLFFPLINQGPLPLVMGVVLLMANMMYGYVRERNGLAAAWLCQIVVSLLVFFIPFAGLV